MSWLLVGAAIILLGIVIFNVVKTTLTLHGVGPVEWDGQAAHLIQCP